MARAKRYYREELLIFCHEYNRTVEPYVAVNLIKTLLQRFTINKSSSSQSFIYHRLRNPTITFNNRKRAWVDISKGRVAFTKEPSLGHVVHETAHIIDIFNNPETKRYHTKKHRELMFKLLNLIEEKNLIRKAYYQEFD